jgi:hypothetical protein
MEGEVFAQNVLGSNIPPTAQEASNARMVNGVNGVKKSTADTLQGPRKPWEQVHFDPALKPKDYQIKGISKSRHEGVYIGYSFSTAFRHSR